MEIPLNILTKDFNGFKKEQQHVCLALHTVCKAKHKVQCLLLKYRDEKTGLKCKWTPSLPTSKDTWHTRLQDKKGYFLLILFYMATRNISNCNQVSNPPPVKCAAQSFRLNRFRNSDGLPESSQYWKVWASSYKIPNASWDASCSWFPLKLTKLEKDQHHMGLSCLGDLTLWLKNAQIALMSSTKGSKKIEGLDLTDLAMNSFTEVSLQTRNYYVQNPCFHKHARCKYVRS